MLLQTMLFPFRGIPEHVTASLEDARKGFLLFASHGKEGIVILAEVKLQKMRGRQMFPALRTFVSTVGQ
jgi:hypothetical protein